MQTMLLEWIAKNLFLVLLLHIAFCGYALYFDFEPEVFQLKWKVQNVDWYATVGFTISWVQILFVVLFNQNRGLWYYFRRIGKYIFVTIAYTSLALAVVGFVQSPLDFSPPFQLCKVVNAVFLFYACVEIWALYCFFMVVCIFEGREAFSEFSFWTWWQNLSADDDDSDSSDPEGFLYFDPDDDDSEPAHNYPDGAIDPEEIGEAFDGFAVYDYQSESEDEDEEYGMLDMASEVLVGMACWFQRRLPEEAEVIEPVVNASPEDSVSSPIRPRRRRERPVPTFEQAERFFNRFSMPDFEEQ